jgi:hypothetical protein
MKHPTTVALMLSLGVASIYAQHGPVKMTFSGSTAATTLNLQPGTVTDEEHFAGNGTLGRFTFRQLRTDVFPFPGQPPSTCSPPSRLYFPVARGGGVFRFQNGSLLKVAITGGDYCIDLTDLTAPVGNLTVAYQITGGTGRFKGVSGALTLNSTLTPVVFAADNSVKLLTNTGTFEGTVSGVGAEEDRDDDERR